MKFHLGELSEMLDNWGHAEPHLVEYHKTVAVRAKDLGHEQSDNQGTE